MMHTKWTCHALTQGIRTIKTFIKYKKATADKFFTKKQEISVECWDHCDEIKTIQRHPAPTTHILQKFSNVCCKIEIFEKIKWFFCF